MRLHEDGTTSPTMQKTLRTYLTAKEAAEFLHRSPKTLRNWRHQEIGPRYVRLGYKEIGYKLEDLEAFVNRPQDY